MADGGNKKHWGYARCPFCFDFYCSHLDRHLLHCKVQPLGLESAKVVAERVRQNQAQTRKNFAENMFFPADAVADRRYTRTEVIDMFERWGHYIVPRGVVLSRQPISNMPCVHPETDWRQEEARLARDKAEAEEQEQATRAAAEKEMEVMARAREQAARARRRARTGFRTSTAARSGNSLLAKKRPGRLELEPESESEGEPRPSTSGIGRKRKTARSAAPVPAPTCTASLHPRRIVARTEVVQAGGGAWSVTGFGPGPSHGTKTGSAGVVVAASLSAKKPRTTLPAPRPKTSTPAATAPRPEDSEDSDISDMAQAPRPTEVSARRKLVLASNSEDEALSDLSGSEWEPTGDDAVEEETSALPSDEEPAACRITPSKRQYRHSGLKGVLNDRGFYAVPEHFANQQVFKDFGAWYLVQGKGKRTRSHNESNVLRALYFMNKGPLFDSRTLNSSNYGDLNAMFEDAKVNPKTAINYCKSLKHFVQFLMGDSARNLRSRDRAEFDRLKAFRQELNLHQRGLEQKAKAFDRERQSSFQNPPNFRQCTAVLDTARPHFEKLLGDAAKRTLNRGEVAYVNRYMSAYMCLFCGERPAVATNMTANEYLQGKRSSIHVENDQQYMVIHVSQHKTETRYAARVVLDLYWMNAFQRYHLDVRSQILNRTHSQAENFLLQFDGKVFSCVSDGIVKLQKQFGLPHYTASHSRVAIETYMMYQATDIRKALADFMCHSENVRDSHYLRKPLKETVSVFRCLQYLHAYNDPGTNTAANSIPPRFVQGLNMIPEPALFDLNLPSVPQPVPQPVRKCKPSATATAPAPDANPGQDQTAALPQPEKGKKRAKPKPKVTSPASSAGSPELTPRREKAETVVRIACEEQGCSLEDLKVPKPKDMVKMLENAGSLCKDEDREKISRIVRHMKSNAIAKVIGQKLLCMEAARQQCEIYQLVDLPAIPESELTDNAYKTVLKQHQVHAGMETIISQHRAQRSDRDDQLELAIKSQSWRGVYLDKADDRLDANAICAEKTLKEGKVVCDFHGLRLTGEEGDKIMGSANSDERTGFIIFYKDDDDKRWCVDASTPCDCHNATDFARSYGQFIQRSKEKANVRPERKKLNGRDVIVFVTVRDIQPGEQLYYDPASDC